MILSLIAAIGKNREIGKGGKLLWHLPDDFSYFKNTTSGHPVIMGRKTFEAIGRPLPNRDNVVITGDRSYTKEGVIILHSLEEALERYRDTDQEVFIIGGAQVYAQALPFADYLYLTHIDGSFDADTFFPKYNENEWKKISEELHSKDENHSYSFSFMKYKKQS